MEFSRRKKEGKDSEEKPLFEQPDVSENLKTIKHKIAIISGKVCFRRFCFLRNTV
ncbi:hypothetical protein H8E77_12780 [bacterium]|nr:hypothetical protein [bacterium]